jgi:hypothetical protein
VPKGGTGLAGAVFHGLQMPGLHGRVRIPPPVRLRRKDPTQDRTTRRTAFASTPLNPWSVAVTRLLKRISSCFAAGAAGGLAAACLLWALGAYGVTGSMGVSLAPPLSPQWLYPKIVWGGLWAQLLLLPIAKSRLIVRGLVVGLGPAAFELLYRYPVVYRKGLFGTALGAWTPLVLLGVCSAWGIATVTWLWWTDRGV